MCAHHPGIATSRSAPADPSFLGDGTWQIRLPMTGNPLGHVNAYLLEDEEGYTLVDCGWKADDVLAALHAGLARCGAALGDVRRLAVTHFHFDHYGLAATLLRYGVPELAMHVRDWEIADRIIGDPAADAAADAWIARNGYALAAPLENGLQHHRTEKAPPTRALQGGERIGRLRAIWTPGHSPGHLCFLDERTGRLLTGDHVLDPVTPHVGFWSDAQRDPLGDYVASLHVVATLGATAALPAHGEPFANLVARVDALLAHESTRESRVIAALALGAADAAGVAARIPWTRRELSLDALTPEHRQLAVAETIAHLEHLRVRALVRLDAGGPSRVYALAAAAAQPF